jgi:PucR family transcriptional regulator, purine catabolism regulatory protein
LTLVDEPASVAASLGDALTRLVVDGGDLDRVAAEVGRMLDAAVLVTSTDGRVRAAATTGPVEAALAAGGWTDPSGRFRVERAASSPAPLGAGEVRLVRVVAEGVDLARLVACRTSAPFTERDTVDLGLAAAIAALLITREHAVTGVENKYQADFLRDLLLGRPGHEAYVEEHLAAFEWDLTRPAVVLCAEIDPAAPDEAPVSNQQHRQWQERFAQAWRQVVREVADGSPLADFSSEVVCVLPLGHPDEADEADHAARADPRAHRIVRRIVEAVAGDKGGGRRSFTVGVSRRSTSLADLPGAYAQARRSVEIGRRLRGPGSTTYFDDLGVHRLIALVPDPAELQAFASDVLGPLAGTTTEATDLRETLQVLLDTNFNVAEAARVQFFHYNTMRYRVGKLERLLGPLSSDPHLRLDAAVALRVLDLAP